MRKPMRRTVAVVLLALVASLLGVVTPGTAYAVESMPEMQWTPVAATGYPQKLVSGPQGSVTLPCNIENGGSDLKTYNGSGQLVRSLPRTDTIDGVSNCITSPVVDKNGVLYGFPYSSEGESVTQGPNLLAYEGNTLKWKYPAHCGEAWNKSPLTVGADGNIYTVTQDSNGGVHLIGLAPELAAGQTQPTKVLDISIGGSCASELIAYKDGIAVGGWPTRFYSYGGKFLGDFPGGWINADGHTFTTGYVAGLVQSFSITKYD